MHYLTQLVNTLFNGLSGLVVAILLLIVAAVVAAVAKSLTMKLLKKLNAQNLLDKTGIADETTGSSLEFVGKLVYVIVFLLFLPGILERIGMSNVAAPISSFITRIINYIPNIIAAVIIIALGNMLAKMIRQLVLPLLKKAKVDSLQQKAGIDAGKETAISNVIANVIYGLIMLIVVVAALQALNISTVSAPAMSMINKVFAIIPNIFSALLLLLFGMFLGKLVCSLLSGVLAGVGVDSFFKKLCSSKKPFKTEPSKLIGLIVKYVIIVLFAVEALNVVGLTVLSVIGRQIIAFLPNVLAAIIIMGAALFAGNWVEKILSDKLSNGKSIGIAAKIIILVVAVFMTLSQLGIAVAIVETSFIIILAALAIAFAVAFGVGGRNFAANMLKKLEEKMERNDSEK